MSREARAETSRGAALWQRRDARIGRPDGSVIKQGQNGHGPRGEGVV